MAFYPFRYPAPCALALDAAKVPRLTRQIGAGTGKLSARGIAAGAVGPDVTTGGAAEHWVLSIARGGVVRKGASS
jgi:hypothetical protein